MSTVERKEFDADLRAAVDRLRSEFSELRAAVARLRSEVATFHSAFAAPALAPATDGDLDPASTRGLIEATAP